MLDIELQLDNITGFITGFRTGWTANAKVKPNPKLVYKIFKNEFYKLVEFLTGRPVILSEKGVLFGHNLKLDALDLQNPLVHKGDFFKSIRKL